MLSTSPKALSECMRMCSATVPPTDRKRCRDFAHIYTGFSVQWRVSLLITTPLEAGKMKLYIILVLASLLLLASSRPANKKRDKIEDGLTEIEDSPLVPRHLLELYNDLNKEDSNVDSLFGANTVRYLENVALGRYSYL